MIKITKVQTDLYIRELWDSNISILLFDEKHTITHRWDAWKVTELVAKFEPPRKKKIRMAKGKTIRSYEDVTSFLA